MLKDRESEIIKFIKENKECSSKEVLDGTALSISYATLKRLLVKLMSDKYIQSTGKGKGTKYGISPTYELIQSIDIKEYYKKEIDEREIKEVYNIQIITEVLKSNCVFTKNELSKLYELQKNHTGNIAQLSDNEYKKDLERLAIDLSWKSSQIEGNTYTLLETERLLKERETASGKTKEEAIMLFNHKDALDFIIANPEYLHPLAVSKIEDIHSILIKDLAVERNIRKRRIGISGTNYRPLDNEFQILEALKITCELINRKDNVFEKALLALLLISYIQPFMDGNKRTARIVSNALLLKDNYCPLSFRTVDSIEYKKALLLFYEQHNIYHFKKLFIDQFEFAVKTYF